jgi:hydrogenase-4 component F
MILALVLIPAAAAAVSFLIKARVPRRILLVVVAAAHSALVAWGWVDPGVFSPVGAWLGMDAPAVLFLSITSILFLAVSIYAVGYLKKHGGIEKDSEEGFLFDNTPEALFTACLLGFLSTMTLVTVSRHFGLLWVAVEATTLMSAPLIHFHRHHRSLEATWKYLLICSVGIAIALLGTYFLAVAASGGGLTFSDIVSHAASLDPAWLKAAFLLLLVGYGTKMGLAPFHTWLPDAHSEAPSLVSALLSGALLNCAFLAILRVMGVLGAAGYDAFARDTLLVFGLLSMVVAAAFIIGQKDFKRMLAYSSVENVGILAVGIGIGGLGNWGSLFHALNHSLVKAALFLAAGNILAIYATKKTAEVRGVLRTAPLTGALWVAGFFAITGAPPFGTFMSELTILRAAVEKGAYGIAAIYVCALVAVFIGMVTIFTAMAQGSRDGLGLPGSAGDAAEGRAQRHAPVRETLTSTLPPLALLAASAVLGLFVPGFLDRVLGEAVKLLGG